MSRIQLRVAGAGEMGFDSSTGTRLELELELELQLECLDGLVIRQASFASSMTETLTPKVGQKNKMGPKPDVGVPEPGFFIQDLLKIYKTQFQFLIRLSP
jgi:hypothetical protein